MMIVKAFYTFGKVFVLEKKPKGLSKSAHLPRPIVKLTKTSRYSNKEYLTVDKHVSYNYKFLWFNK